VNESAMKFGGRVEGLSYRDPSPPGIVADQDEFAIIKLRRIRLLAGRQAP